MTLNQQLHPMKLHVLCHEWECGGNIRTYHVLSYFLLLLSTALLLGVMLFLTHILTVDVAAVTVPQTSSCWPRPSHIYSLYHKPSPSE